MTSDVDPPVAAQPLHVVAGDQAAEAVPDDVHPLVAGLLADALDVLTEVGGAAGHVGQQRAVVPGADVREAAPAQAAAHHGEDRAVVDQPVHEQHRDAGGQRVGGEQRTDGGRLLAGPVAGSGRSASVRVPSGYISTWAPTQASSVRPPVRVAGLHSAAQATSWRSRPARGSVCDSGPARGPLECSRMTPGFLPSASDRRRRGFRPAGRCTW